jgi:hypothetical protein
MGRSSINSEVKYIMRKGSIFKERKKFVDKIIKVMNIFLGKLGA